MIYCGAKTFFNFDHVLNPLRISLADITYGASDLYRIKKVRRRETDNYLITKNLRS